MLGSAPRFNPDTLEANAGKSVESKDGATVEVLDNGG